MKVTRNRILLFSAFVGGVVAGALEQLRVKFMPYNETRSTIRKDSSPSNGN